MNPYKECFLIDNDVEDNEIFCLALNEVDETIACTCATNGIKALEILRSNENYVPSFIFLDMNMPLMNGLECLKLLRRIDKLNHVPIYMYSTGHNKELLTDAKYFGATDFIEKPSSFEQLVQILRMLVKEQKQHVSATTL